jgi:hypothetical protein
MSIFLFLLAQSAAATPAASPPPAVIAPPPPSLSAEQQRDIDCVATLAIIANDQERGAPGAEDYPLVVERGRTWAGIVGERVMEQSGLPREAVRDAILAAVAAQQARVRDVADPAEIVGAQMAICLPLLDAQVPPERQPSLPECAGLLQIAYDEVYAREGLSSVAKDLKTLAFVLESRAREQYLADGYSSSESDVLLTTLREKLLAAARDRAARGLGDDLDFDHCFALAAPKPNESSGPHG